MAIPSQLTDGNRSRYGGSARRRGRRRRRRGDQLGPCHAPVGVAVAIGSALGPLLASGAVIFADEKLHTRAAQEFSQHVKESAARSARQYADSRAADLRAAWGGVSETSTPSSRI